jgi:type IV secretion system protein VirB8
MSTLKEITADQERSLYQAGLSWEADTERSRRRSERRAWNVAGAACALAIIAVVSLASLAPLRRIVPYLLIADKASGNVEFVGAVDDRQIKGYQELLDKHWVQTYIVARESYFYRLLQADYDTVMALSDDSVAKDYARIFEGPDARDKKYGNTVEAHIQIISLRPASTVAGNLMVVRFSKSVRQVDADFWEPAQNFAATVRYQYSPSMQGSEKQLLLNPLGFRVSGYRRDAELPSVEATAKTAAARSAP